MYVLVKIVSTQTMLINQGYKSNSTSKSKPVTKSNPPTLLSSPEHKDQAFYSNSYTNATNLKKKEEIYSNRRTTTNLQEFWCKNLVFRNDIHNLCICQRSENFEKILLNIFDRVHTHKINFDDFMIILREYLLNDVQQNKIGRAHV
eukprot:TRINITY_DN3978_c1_g1_i3.p1 TRINITY_DN3978_c1_g1~~TRINITY_DN3978_c1_g1_i3.p1  ORF type:complete len:156 (-),score=2.73 TRINITY_DN3978_c1_g1_i3:49-486(-)